MTKSIKLNISILLIISFLNVSLVFAGANDLAKQAGKLIRNAERKMFSGKIKDADALLDKAGALIAQGKKLAPDNRLKRSIIACVK
jgi:hypothetical protein